MPLPQSHFRTRTRALALCVAASLAAASVAPVVHADKANPTAEEIATARSLGIEGVNLADGGDCAGAIEKLQRAEDLYHAPTILGRLGECQVKVGKLVLGTENLNKVVREELGPKSPDAFKAAQVRAKKVLDEALPRIAKLKLSVEGAPADAKVTVKVDGVEVPKAMLGVERPTDPGSHKVEASAPGYLPATEVTTLADGASGAVTLQLKVDPDYKPPKEPPKEISPNPDKPPKDGGLPSSGGARSSNTAGWVVLGLGGAGVVVGSVFGIMALSTKSTLDGKCKNKECPSTSQKDIDSLKSQATFSTVGFAVGIVGVGVGVAMLALSGSAEPGPAPSARVRPWVNVGVASTTAGVTGEF